MNLPVATIDYETRSACDLKKQGTWKYSIHASTEILCLAFRLPHWQKGRTALWQPGFPALGILKDGREDLAELEAWVHEDGLVEAHNVWFEFCIWKNIQQTRYGCVEIPLRQWRCSAAKAAVHALPRGLDVALKALRVPFDKDLEGNKAMKKMAKPRKSRKAERTAWENGSVAKPKYLWWESKELFERIWAYCRQDVLAEEGLSKNLDDLSDAETEVFLADLAINLRGFQLDRQAVRTALTLVPKEARLLNRELRVLTGGKVKKATQRAKMLAWFDEQNFPLPNTQAATIDELLVLDYPEMPAGIRRCLELMRALGRSSTAKYQAMRAWMGRDARVRGALLYHGASTGRWAGKGIQPQNFPKGTLKHVVIEELWGVLKRMDRVEIQQRYTGVMEALSSALRGAIIARRGRQLYVADYAAIEARVLLWLADDQDALEMFRTGQDIYLAMASDIYGYVCTKQEHPTERALGKIAILGLGYQMGANGFVGACEKFGITIEPELSETVVERYRSRFYRVKQMWAAQEAAAKQAVRTNKSVVEGRMRWWTQGRFLYCQLPSGRKLAYPFPQLKDKLMSWGETRESLSYMGINPVTHQWQRQTSYGGLLVENQTQAVARDLMAEAILRCGSTPYAMVLSVHDELIAEAPVGIGSVPAFVRLLTQPPEWAPDCPIEAEGWSGLRYRK